MQDIIIQRFYKNKLEALIAEGLFIFQVDNNDVLIP